MQPTLQVASHVEPGSHRWTHSLKHDSSQDAPASQVCSQLPPMRHDNVHSAPSSHRCVQSPPVHSKKQLAPAEHVCVHPPPSQKKAQLADSAPHDCSQPPPWQKPPHSPSVAAQTLVQPPPSQNIATRHPRRSRRPWLRVPPPRAWLPSSCPADVALPARVSFDGAPARADNARVSKRGDAIDREGRQWTVSLVPIGEADDPGFWLELTPEQRVDAVDECLVTCMKTRGRSGAPRLRRVHRLVERRSR